MRKPFKALKRSDAGGGWMKERPIGDALRQQYSDALNEPVPKKLTDLIKKMRDSETKR